MFKSNQELFQATHELIVSLDDRGHLLEAEALRDGLISLNGLTDGWALLLDAVGEVESKGASVLSDSEREKISEIHDTVYHLVYRRERKPWNKFF
jgi:hypothetical protein